MAPTRPGETGSTIGLTHASRAGAWHDEGLLTCLVRVEDEADEPAGAGQLDDQLSGSAGAD